MALIIVLHNDGSGLSNKGNYDYKVFINKRLIAKGRVEGHHREKGWEQLVFDLWQSTRPRPH